MLPDRLDSESRRKIEAQKFLDALANQLKGIGKYLSPHSESLTDKRVD